MGLFCTSRRVLPDEFSANSSSNSSSTVQVGSAQDSFSLLDNQLDCAPILSVTAALRQTAAVCRCQTRQARESPKRKLC
jgi:hypothetical protein